jgi:hypothetical protein
VKVLLEYKVDPSLLSGICVNIGDKYIDLSAGGCTAFAPAMHPHTVSSQSTASPA